MSQKSKNISFKYMSLVDLKSQTLTNLKKYAKELRISGYSTFKSSNKSELAKKILNELKSSNKSSKSLKNMSLSELKKQTLKNLKGYAKELGISGYSKFKSSNKSELAQKILNELKSSKKPSKSLRKSRRSTRKIDKVYSQALQDCITRSKLKTKEHQNNVINFLNRDDKRGLLVIHSVGSGKTLTAVVSSQCFLDKNPSGNVIVVTPTSLQENFKKEILAYGTDPKDKRYMFYTIQGFVNASKRKEIKCKNCLLILDEAHNIRTEIDQGGGVNAKHLVDFAKKSKKVLLLTATPLVNKPFEIVNQMAMVEGKDPLKALNYDLNELEDYFNCKVSVFSPPLEDIQKYYPKSESHDIFIKMSPAYLKKYLKVEENSLDDENKVQIFGKASNLKAFYNGVRRASNNLEEKKSPKVEWIINFVENTQKEEKILIFSHWLNAGLKLLMSRLSRKKISFLHIDGTMNQKKRKEAVEEYNRGNIKILLISKAGGEGLDLKNTRYVIIMEPAWNTSTIQQVIGRAIRYKSHISLPEDSRKVDVYKLFMVKPKENIDKIVRENLLENDETSELLSVDIFLRNLAIYKQIKIDKFMEIIKKSSIENRIC